MIPESFQTLSTVAPCQAVFAGAHASLWLTCHDGQSTVRARDRRSGTVHPLEVDAIGLQSAFNTALAGRAHVRITGPAGAFSLQRVELINGHDYCLTGALPEEKKSAGGALA